MSDSYSHIYHKFIRQPAPTIEMLSNHVNVSTAQMIDWVGYI